MLNKILVAKAAERLKNPTRRTPVRERLLFASMAAESLKLEGINTSTEDVLACDAPFGQGCELKERLTDDS